MQPIISVILATHNGAQYIREAIQSVLEQSERRIELIIVDDFSSDNTEKIITSIADTRIRLIRNHSWLGLTKSLNRGLTGARGKYIARIDDDDVWTQVHKLSRQLQFLEANTNVGLLGTAARVVNEQRELLYTLRYPLRDEELRARMLYRNQFNHSSIMVRRSALAAAGGMYDAAKARSQDYNLWLRIGLQAELANFPDAMVDLRQRRNAVSERYHQDQFWSFVQAAYKYRHAYPNFYRYTPVYVREAILNVMPRATLERIKSLRQIWL